MILYQELKKENGENDIVEYIFYFILLLKFTIQLIITN